ncbi:acyltransferase family protein [Pseudooceanicola sp. C21-150M6]|uniref:acyltransferase family protein n=1 Tax=Pseudooceanicola sp. C21-150M6 TaxID=3434355 RepID=UPI003D7FCDF0
MKADRDVTEKAALPGRDDRIDLARGIAMILVVFGHALVGAKDAGQDTFWVRFLLVVIYSTHMALFFEVSGILSGSMAKRPWAQFTTSMLQRIVWPYVLWSFVIYSIHFMMSGYTNAVIAEYQPWRIFIRPPAVMWFLYVLFIAMIILRVLAPLDRRVTLVVGAVLLLAPYVYSGWPENSRFVGLFLLAAVAGKAAIPYLTRPAFVAVSAAIMCVVVVMAWMQSLELLPGYPASQARYIPALVAGPALIFAACHLARSTGVMSGVQRFLVYVGQKTMAIFVTHILITAGSRIGLRLVGIDSWPLIILIATVLGVGLPLIAVTITDRLNLSKWLGWR